jgi:hypothetical protein
MKTAFALFWIPKIEVRTRQYVIDVPLTMILPRHARQELSLDVTPEFVRRAAN